MLQHVTSTLVQDDEPSHVMAAGLESWILVLLVSQSSGCVCKGQNGVGHDYGAAGRDLEVLLANKQVIGQNF